MFIDEVGATRHAISDKELNELYKRLENFIADCTIEEAKENRDAFVKVETLIHQRIRENKKIILISRGKPRHKPRAKMKAKNVNLNTLLYIVEADKIQAVKPDAVGKTENGIIQIAFRSKYRSNVETKPDDEQIERYILNFPAAKRKQSEMRKRKIQNAYKEMQDAINRYNEVIEKYFDKPLTSDSEVEIINY